MKKITPFLFAVPMSLHGFTVSTANLVNPDATAVPILLPSGEAIPSGTGSVAVGYFDTLTNTQLMTSNDSSLIFDDFVQFSGIDSEQAFTPTVGADGFFSLSFEDEIPQGGNDFTGQTIYIFIGNDITLESSTHFALYDSGEEFGEDNVVGLGFANAFITDPASGLIRGKNVEDADIDLPVIFNTAIELERIPELSSSMLITLSLGALGFRRRR